MSEWVTVDEINEAGRILAAEEYCETLREERAFNLLEETKK